MKKRFLTWLKNAAVMLIASLMLLGIIPLGMISLYSTANAEGDFLRLYPEAELSLTSDISQKTEEESALEDVHEIGKNHYGYFRFDLHEFIGKKAKKINKVVLRMTLQEASSGNHAPVQVWLMPEERWSKSMKWEEKPDRVGEILVATATLSKDQKEQPQLFEVDLTEYVRKHAEEGKGTISFRLDSQDEGVSAVCAGVAHEDPTYRPCLKILTGQAEDPDQKSLDKITLKEKFVTHKQGNTVAVVGKKKEIYLKFSLNSKNIQGGIYRAILAMNCRRKDAGARLRIDRLENTDWTAKDIKEKGVQGKRYLVYREEDAGVNGEYNEINLTEAINDAYINGKKEIAFALYSEQGEIAFALDRKNQPRIQLSVSDDRSVVAMTEMVGELLGENPDRHQIESNLMHNYIAENGVRTAATWVAAEKETGQDAKEILGRTGKVVAPVWFREDSQLVVNTTVTSGKYRMDLLYYLTVPSEEAPDFSETTFDTMIDVGTKAEEKKNLVELIGTTAHSRRVDGQKFTYRKIKKDEMMILHLSVDPENQNYLTVKLWEEDDFPGLSIASLQEREQKKIEIQETDMSVKEESGFRYLTYPIPLSYTKGRDYASLRITMLEQEENEQVQTPEEAESDTVQEEVPDPESNVEQIEEPTMSVYGIYTTQTAYFDPMVFAEQGEPVIKKEESEEPALYQFLKKIYGEAMQSLNFRDETNSEEPMIPKEEKKGVYIDAEKANLATLIVGKEETLMADLPKQGTKARIYRDTPYYNAYAETTVRRYFEDSLLGLKYGIYRVFRNQGEEEQIIPWQEEAMAGLYQNLTDETYYSFLEKGQMVDDSVLAEGTQVNDGGKIAIQPGETLVLMKVAEPFYYADIRVSEINNQTVAELKLKDPMEISSMTFRVMGAVPEEEEKTVILCAVYERGMLVGLEKQFLTVSPGQVAAEILLEEPLVLMPGQTLKVFVEARDTECKAMTPVLELPQKQAAKEQQ